VGSRVQFEGLTGAGDVYDSAASIDSNEEIKVAELNGCLGRVVPYYAQEQIGVALLKRACDAPGATKRRRALETAVLTARALVFEMGSTTPWLVDQFQDLRYVITDRVINGAPVWAAEVWICC
jgi:hypothetical protein